MKANQLGEKVKTLRSQTMSFANDGLELSLHLPDAHEVKETFSNFVNTIERQDKSIVGLKARLNITQESLKQKDSENQKLTQALAHALLEMENNYEMFQKEMRNFVYNIQGYESKEIQKPKNLKSYLNTFKVAMPTLVLPEDKEIDPDVDAYIASEVNIVKGITLDSTQFATEEGAKPQSSVSFQSKQISRTGSTSSIPPPLESAISTLPTIKIDPRSLNPLPKNPSRRWKWAIHKVIKNNRLLKLNLGLVNIRNEPTDSLVQKITRLEGDLFHLSSSIKEELNKVINEHFNSLNEKINSFEGQLNDFQSRYQLDWERNERKFKETENEFEKVKNIIDEFKTEQKEIQQNNIEKINNLTLVFKDFHSYFLNMFQNEILFISQNLTKLESNSTNLLSKCEDNSLSSQEENKTDVDEDEMEQMLSQLLQDDIKLSDNKKDFEELNSNFIRYETNISRLKNLVQLFHDTSLTKFSLLTDEQEIASLGNLSENLNNIEYQQTKLLKENLTTIKKIFARHDKVLRKYFIDINKKRKALNEKNKMSVLNIQNKFEELENSFAERTKDNNKLIFDRFDLMDKSIDEKLRNFDPIINHNLNRGNSTDSISAETDTNIGGVGTLSVGDSVNGNVLMNSVVSVKREIGAIKQQIKEMRDAFFNQLSENLFDFDDEDEDDDEQEDDEKLDNKDKQLDANQSKKRDKSIKETEVYEEIIEEIIEVKDSKGEIICQTSRPTSGKEDGEIIKKVDEKGNEIVVRVKSAKKSRPTSSKENLSSSKVNEKSDSTSKKSKKDEKSANDKASSSDQVEDEDRDKRKKANKARANAIQNMIASALSDDKIEEKIVKILQILLPEYTKPTNIIHHYEHSHGSSRGGINNSSFSMNNPQTGFTFPNIQKLLGETNSKKTEAEKSIDENDQLDEVEKKRLKASLMGSFVDYDAKKILATYPETDSNSLVSDLANLKNENNNLKDKINELSEFVVTKDSIVPLCQDIVRDFYHTINNHNMSLQNYNQFSRNNSASGLRFQDKNNYPTNPNLVNELSTELSHVKNDYERSINNLKQELENVKKLTLELQNVNRDDDKSIATTKALCIGCGRPSTTKLDTNRPHSPTFIPTLTANLPQGNPDVYRGGFRLPGHSPPNIALQALNEPEIPLIMRERVVTSAEEKMPLPVGVTLPQILHNHVSSSISISKENDKSHTEEKNLNVVRFAPDNVESQYKRNFFRKGLPGKKSSKAETMFAPERFDLSGQSIPSLLSASTPNLHLK